jgi:hypothetical protein
MSAFQEYRTSVAEAREWFEKSHSAVFSSYDVLNQGFVELSRCLQLGRDSSDKTHISLAPLLFILQRQAFVALDSLASRQAYQAWLIVRPGIESALFIGKWIDDIENYRIWDAREQDPKRYTREYSGNKLRSDSLPCSAEIQTSLKTINDLFAHPNPDYYQRHTSVRPVGEMVQLELKFFDSDEFHWASVLGMLHLLIRIQDSLARAFAGLFVNIEHSPDRYGLKGFVVQHRRAALEAAKAGKLESQVINEIGLWHLAADA